MATYKIFEELEIWQLARQLSLDIYKKTLIGTFSRDFALRDQINRSTGSVMDNIAEGFERDGTREFIQFLGYSKGSNGEVGSQLYRAFDRKHLSLSEFDDLSSRKLSLGKQIGGYMNYLKQSTYPGKKFQR